jgi:hypothetical protein
MLVTMNPYVITNSPHEPIGDDARVDVFDTADGSLVKTLSFGGQIASPSGIDVSGPAFALIEVAIDIVPGNPDNEINLLRDKSVDVIAFGEETFDVNLIDPQTVAFAGASIQLHKKKGPTYWIQDANGDGIDDLRARFTVEELELTTSDTSALLTAETTGGDFVFGSDSVSVVATRGRGNKK